MFSWCSPVCCSVVEVTRAPVLGWRCLTGVELHALHLRAGAPAKSSAAGRGEIVECKLHGQRASSGCGGRTQIPDRGGFLRRGGRVWCGGGALLELTPGGGARVIC